MLAKKGQRALAKLDLVLPHITRENSVEDHGEQLSAPLEHERHALSWNASRHDSREAYVVHRRCGGTTSKTRYSQDQETDFIKFDHPPVLPHSNIRLNCLV